MMKRLLPLLLLLLALPVHADEAKSNPDPWMGMNRKVYGFNQFMDRHLFTPLAKGYQFITPSGVDHSITRFFSNLGDIANSLNNLLQFKPVRALSDLGRFAVNSTVGVFGLFDVATHMGLQKSDEDFGQTLGKWGVPPGPYVVLPFLGSSSLRDAVGLIFDFRTYIPGYDPNTGRSYGMLALDFVDTRADYLGSTRVLNTASPDTYAFEREVYLQRRVDEVSDGQAPPPEDEDLDFLMQDDTATTTP